MNRIANGLAAAALSVTLVLVGLPAFGFGGGGMSLHGTGSTGCCKQ